MAEHSIDELLRSLPEGELPRPEFESRLRAHLQNELAASSSASHRTPPNRQEITVLTPNQSRPPSRWGWTLAAAAGVVALLVGAFVVLARGDDASTPADDPAPTTPPPEASTNVEPGTAEAIDTASNYFAAFGRGDADVVIAVSDPVTTNVAAESALVAWWSATAAPGGDGAVWPTSECSSPASGGGTVTVACPVAVVDPVAIELGADQLVWTADVSDDGVVRRRAEPLTVGATSYQPVWSAHADYLSLYVADRYATSCSPDAVPSGERFAVSGLALTGDCGALVAEHATDAADWIRDGRPESRDEIPLSVDSLAGLWTNVGGRTSGWTDLLVDFRPDGTFTIGNTGGLYDEAFAGGTYEIDDDQVVFTSTFGGCRIEPFVWTAVSHVDGELEVDVAPSADCTEDYNWRWVRVSPASRASLAFEPGTSETATRSVPESPSDLRGIWLRLGSDQVLATEADGAYVVIEGGDSTTPIDRGVLSVPDAGVLVFESGGEGDCAAGDTWTWTEVTVAGDLIRENNPRGTTLRTESSELCGTDGASDTWRLLSPIVVQARP